MIRMGLEPMTRSLEGCCSNPTELPNQPWLSYEKRCKITAFFLNVQTFRLKFVVSVQLSCMLLVVTHKYKVADLALEVAGALDGEGEGADDVIGLFVCCQPLVITQSLT